MARLSKKPMSLTALERVVVPNLDGFFESVRITSAQLSGITEAAANLARAYDSFAIPLQGVIREFAKSQQRIAEAIVKLSTNAALFDQIDIVIRSFPIPEFPTFNFPIPEIQLQPIQIFIQPAPSYIPPKALPAPKRKQTLQLTAINIKEDGFTINGEYIRGMTTNSKPGRLLELFIRKDLAGSVSDSLIYETMDIEVKDYRAIGFVLRDLKDILMGNKLELIMDRYRGIKQYKATGVTKRIRKSKKNKKQTKTSKSN